MMIFAMAGLLLTHSLGGRIGLVEYVFDHEARGNPYDATVNDVRVIFRTDEGVVERMAFFDGVSWRARLRAKEGEQVTAVIRTRDGVTPVKALLPVLPLKDVEGGIVRVGPKARGGALRPFLADENGSGFFPIGCNLAWQNGGEPSIPAQLKAMSAVGINWTRIWANHWDGKNPFWVSGVAPIAEGWMYPSALNKWDEIVSAAAAEGIRFQLVLFHHGPWSVDVNSNWAENPWNKANGGWLAEPREFFTDANAKKYCKNWLRYAVARYGYSGSVLAWELFNEVEWTQPARQDKNWALVKAWHDEMAGYLRSIDTDRHLVTSSSMEHLEMFESLDFYQPHVYPTSVKGAMQAMGGRADSRVFW